jgi:hypothetical protein
LIVEGEIKVNSSKVDTPFSQIPKGFLGNRSIGMYVIFTWENSEGVSKCPRDAGSCKA